MKNITRVLTFIFIGLSAFIFVNYTNVLAVPNVPNSQNPPQTNTQTNSVPDAPNPPQNQNEVPTVPPAPTLFPGCCEATPTTAKAPTPTKPPEDGRGGPPGENKPGDGGGKNNERVQGGAQVLGLSPTSGDYTQIIGLIMVGSLMLLVAVKGYNGK